MPSDGRAARTAAAHRVRHGLLLHSLPQDCVLCGAPGRAAIILFVRSTWGSIGGWTRAACPRALWKIGCGADARCEHGVCRRQGIRGCVAQRAITGFPGNCSSRIARNSTGSWPRNGRMTPRACGLFWSEWRWRWRSGKRPSTGGKARGTGSRARRNGGGQSDWWTRCSAPGSAPGCSPDRVREGSRAPGPVPVVLSEPACGPVSVGEAQLGRVSACAAALENSRSGRNARVRCLSARGVGQRLRP